MSPSPAPPPPEQDPASAGLLALISHQLRTPLNGVVGMIELLRATRLDREQSGYLETLSQSAEALLSIVNTVIDLSEIGSGRLEREQRVFSPLQLAQDTTALVRPHAQAKGLRLLLWCGALPERLLGEPTRLQQIWLSLLSNAIKFTEHGEVRFDLNVSPAAPSDPGTLVLHGLISDTGRGIARDEQRAIVQAFDAADETTLPSMGGPGLGLTMASRLARRMGGKLTLESEPGVGSRLGFSVRVELPAMSTEFQPDDPQIGARIAALRVLVAEDNPIHQVLAIAVLAKFGIAADLAADGIEALERARTQPYDVILMDIQMPRMTGHQATQAIRRLPDSGASRPWIIAVTANAFDQDRELCLASGMNDFISKPFRQEGLRDALMQSLRASAFRPGPAR
jgi:CheY-like chemotaxis protein